MARALWVLVDAPAAAKAPLPPSMAAVPPGLRSSGPRVSRRREREAVLPVAESSVPPATGGAGAASRPLQAMRGVRHRTAVRSGCRGAWPVLEFPEGWRRQTAAPTPARRGRSYRPGSRRRTGRAPPRRLVPRPPAGHRLPAPTARGPRARPKSRRLAAARGNRFRAPIRKLSDDHATNQNREACCLTPIPSPCSKRLALSLPPAIARLPSCPRMANPQSAGPFRAGRPENRSHDRQRSRNAHFRFTIATPSLN